MARAGVRTERTLPRLQSAKRDADRHSHQRRADKRAVLRVETRAPTFEHHRRSKVVVCVYANSGEARSVLKSPDSRLLPP